MSFMSIGAEPSLSIPGERLPGLCAEPSVPGERRVGDIFPVKRTKTFRGTGLNNLSTPAAFEYLKNFHVDDDYDPRKSEYIVQATDDEVKMYQTAKLEKQIARLEGAIRAREMAEHGSIILDNYRQVLREMYQELRYVKGLPGNRSNLRVDIDSLCEMETEVVTDMCKELVRELRKEMRPSLALGTSSLGNIPCKPFAEVREGSLDSISTATAWDSSPSDASSNVNSSADLPDGYELGARVLQKKDYLVKEIDLDICEMEWGMDPDDNSYEEPEPELTPLAHKKVKPSFLLCSCIKEDEFRTVSRDPMPAMPREQMQVHDLGIRINLPPPRKCGDVDELVAEYATGG